MTEKQIEKYIKSLGKIKNLNIDSDALSSAIGDMIKSVDDGTFHEKTTAKDLLHLLIENKPISALHTHSYGFHTASGRYIIETLINKYNGYKSNNQNS